MKRRLIIIGGGGHGKVVADIAKLNQYDDICFLDDGANVAECGEYRIIGKCDDAIKYPGCDFIVAIGNAKVRQSKLELLQKANLNIVTLIHPSSVISESVDISEGSVVMAGAVINPFAKIGKGCIINTSSSVDHDCIIGNYAHVSVGSHIAGSVEIGERTWIGIGAIVSNNLSITDDCMIGAGAIVVKNIDKPGVYIGVPATLMK